MAAHPPEAQMPFIRNLASSDRKLRTSALSSLKLFLSTRETLPLDEARKLWTGLYYAMWMTDRPIPQQTLAAELAGLHLASAEAAAVRPSCAIPWLQGFWSVLGAQWPSIDALRMEKFLLLTRLTFGAHVRLAASEGYQGPLVDEVLEVFRKWCFDDGEEGAEGLRRVPVGLRLHVLDVWVDELERTGALADEKAGDFVKQVGEIVEGLKRCPIKPVRGRADDSYADGRLPWAVESSDKGDEEEDDGSDDGWGGFED